MNELVYSYIEKFYIEKDYNLFIEKSKVADLFVLQHEFCVDNKDINRVAPVLDGFGGEAYINL